MSTHDTIRAWKDEDYRLSMGIHVDNPAGAIELDDQDLGGVAGGSLEFQTMPLSRPFNCWTWCLLCQP